METVIDPEEMVWTEALDWLDLPDLCVSRPVWDWEVMMPTAHRD